MILNEFGTKRPFQHLTNCIRCEICSIINFFLIYIFNLVYGDVEFDIGEKNIFSKIKAADWN